MHSVRVRSDAPKIIGSDHFSVNIFHIVTISELFETFTLFVIICFTFRIQSCVWVIGHYILLIKFSACSAI